MPSRRSEAAPYDCSQPLLKTRGAEIRDAAMARIDALGLFQASRVVPTFQWQPDDATAAAVYLKRERKSALGDPNAGEPSFEVDIVLGISVLTRVDDPADLEYATSFYSDPIERALLTDTTFLSLFEAVTSVERFAQFPPSASAYMSDTRLELTVAFKEYWAPDVPDDYRRTELTTRLLDQGAGPEITTVIDAAQD